MNWYSLQIEILLDFAISFFITDHYVLLYGFVVVMFSLWCDALDVPSYLGMIYGLIFHVLLLLLVIALTIVRFFERQNLFHFFWRFLFYYIIFGFIFIEYFWFVKFISFIFDCRLHIRTLIFIFFDSFLLRDSFIKSYFIEM